MGRTRSGWSSSRMEWDSAVTPESSRPSAASKRSTASSARCSSGSCSRSIATDARPRSSTVGGRSGRRSSVVAIASWACWRRLEPSGTRSYASTAPATSPSASRDRARPKLAAAKLWSAADTIS